MKTIAAWTGALMIVLSSVLAGCGGGSVDAVIVVPQPVPIAFGLTMRVNGIGVPGVNLLPDMEQDVYVPVGNNFEITASGPVAWTVVVGGNIVNAPVGSSILYLNARILPAVVNNARYAANTDSAGFLLNPIVVSVIATSLVDGRQEAQINVVLTN